VYLADKIKKLCSMVLSYEATDRALERIQLGLIVVFVSIPLFVQLPFKINLFLAWEGAYRLSIGQVPFRDFSLPMGFGFWLLPALFFKLFGPYLFTLVKAQVFINLIGALAFRAILKMLGLTPAKVLLALLVYCISFIFVNFWPWYNHTVFIFELLAIYFLFAHIFTESNQRKIWLLLACSFFVILSFFTKQDGGALAIATVTVMLCYHCWIERSAKWLLVYVGFSLALTSLFVLPFLPYQFAYWFNLGQAPHNSRVNLGDLLKDIFEGSEWIKFYLLAVVVVVISRAHKTAEYLRDKKEVLFVLLTVCILGQAILIQVTSYIPHNVNIYFHSFAFAFLLHFAFNFRLEKIATLLLVSIFIMFWWSADYWRYSLRLVERVSPGLVKSSNSLDQVSKYTWSIPDSTKLSKPLRWSASHYRTFEGVLLPEGTIQGIDALMKMDILNKKNIQVLNMSELTPLAYEMGFTPITPQPLWFHKNVSLFDREINDINNNIIRQKYDLVLFEVIPNLNQFYPNEVRETLKTNYIQVDSFQAPRDNSTCTIEVFIRKTTD
jgi:hypothetical protein